MSWTNALLFLVCCNVAAVTGPDMPEPDLSGTEADVRAALQHLRAETEARLAQPGVDQSERAEALAGLGLLYQAHLILEPALACFRAAAREAPGDYRWPYHMGHAHQQGGYLEQAEAAYARALGLAPELPLAHLRLGAVRLELGRIGEAEKLLVQAAAAPELKAAALFELGKAAYTRRDFGHAVDLLERALAQAPGADRIHYTLALAYRGAGHLEQARRHLALRGDTLPGFPDPLTDVLKDLSTGQRMLFHSAMNAAQKQDYATATALFLEGLSVDGGNVHARISLARFLYLTGDAAAAEAQLRAVLRLRPGMPLAGFLLAVLLDAQGEAEQAKARFRDVLNQDPSHPGAHFYLANTLMRNGEYSDAARHYGASLQRAGGNPGAWFWRILASIRAGLPHAELKALLESAHAGLPDDPAMTFLLASLLAASPDGDVRDGLRALELARGLMQARASVRHLELLAMAQAESGNSSAAASTQEQVLEVLRDGFRWDLISPAEAKLEDYRSGKVCREPWPGDMLDMAWPSPGTHKALMSYPPDRPY